MIMMNLFSVFDPISYFGLTLNWIIIFILLLFFSSSSYMIMGGYKIMFINLMKIINNVFKEIAMDKYMGIVFLSVVSFIYLMMANLMGLFPFVFSFTAHIFITMGMGLVFWLSFFLMGWMKNFKMSAAHLVPEGSPLFLSPLMVLIESISHLMRPFTLSIRLAANIMSGHLIIGLLSSISIINYFSLLISLFLQSMLLLLEFGVAIIQGFVFSVLLLLYYLEYY